MKIITAPNTQTPIPTKGFDFPIRPIRADAPLKKPSDAALSTFTLETVAAETDVIAAEPAENTEIAASAVAMILVLILFFLVIVSFIMIASF